MFTFDLEFSGPRTFVLFEQSNIPTSSKLVKLYRYLVEAATVLALRRSHKEVRKKARQAFFDWLRLAVCS